MRKNMYCSESNPDPKTWVNRISLIRDLETQSRDAEWIGNTDEANRLNEIICQERKLLVTDGELVVPF